VGTCRGGHDHTVRAAEQLLEAADTLDIELLGTGRPAVRVVVQTATSSVSG
jgi:hypothetical protein